MRKTGLCAVIIVAWLFAGTSHGAIFAGNFSVLKKQIRVSPSAFSVAVSSNKSNKKVHIAVLIDPVFNPSDLQQYRWRMVSRIGSIATLEGPAGTEQFLALINGIRYVERPVSLGVKALMDTARKYTHLDEVQGTRPSNLPKAYSGKGILIGIIDTEFDTHHPAFLDSLGKTRILALWDQTDTTNASPPGPYGYGTVKYQNQLQQDSLFGLGGLEYHGTGMLSYAAGSEKSRPYYGAAPRAMLACVKYNDVGAVTIDGLNWLFHLADSLGVPCVVNMSIGLASGPHDGTSLVDQTVDNLGAAGKIIVGAVGNDSNLKNHVKFTLTTGQSLGTFIPHTVDTLSKSPLHLKTNAGIDLWGDAGKNITATLFVIDSSSKTFKQSNQFSSTLFTTTGYLPDTVVWPTAADTTIFYIMGDRRSALNNKPHLEIYAFGNNPRLFAGVKVTISNGGSIHGWSLIRKPFYSFGTTGFQVGDSMYTVNEIGGTAKRIICVGAYINKTRVIQWDGTPSQRKNDSLLYGLAEYSSFGPTVDGRIRPDITAPGDAVVGALSRDATLFNELIVWPNTANTIGRYCINGGTSVAAPLVAGIVALMLEANPLLTPEDVLQTLQQTAVTDTYTGTIATPNNKWGAGKVNALGALQQIDQLPVKIKPQPISHENPTLKPGIRNGFLYVASSDQSLLPLNSVIEIFSMQGKKLALESYGKMRMIDLEKLGSGAVIVRIKNGESVLSVSAVTIK